MPNNKLKDNEIIKAQEHCCEEDGCDRSCPLFDKCKSPIKTMEDFIKFDLDLINRLQAKVIKEQNKNSKLRNERNHLQAKAYKECIEKVKNYIKTHCNPYGKPDFDYDTSIKILNFIDNLKKELVGEEIHE